MTEVNVTSDGTRRVDVIVTVPQPTVPTSARPADVGLVEISTDTIRGSIWFTGTGAPVDPGQQTGDMYLDMDTGNVYQWDGDSWQFQGTFAPSTDTPAEVLAKIVQVDGAGSGLDADLLDGHDSPYFATDADLDSLTVLVDGNQTSITAIEAEQVTQNNRLTSIEGVNTAQDSRLNGIDTLNTTQNTRLDAVETKNGQQDTRLTNIETLNTTQDGRLTAVESKNTAQDGRLDAIETVNTSQDTAIAGKLSDAPNDGLTYGRKSLAWATIVGGAVVADTAPPGPLQNGQLWWESDTGNTFIYVVDPSGPPGQWVQQNVAAPVATNTYVLKSGDTMSGLLTLAATPNPITTLMGTALNFIRKTIYAGTGPITLHADTRSFFVEIVGGGGGSSGCAPAASSAGGGGGGGGGGYCSKWIIRQAGMSPYITIGAGGAAAVTNAAGGAGGTTQYTDGGFNTLTATGGNGAQGTAHSVNAYFSIGGYGGSGAGGDFNMYGQIGGCGLGIGATAMGASTLSCMGGFGGSTPFGIGGGQNGFNGSAGGAGGFAPQGFGGGAGGGSACGGGSVIQGTAGNPGCCVITEFR